MSSPAQRLAGARVVICMGAGGVGKTTASAALALGLAASGKRVALVTIDPARRLAEALGLEALGNRPRPVDSTAPSSRGAPPRGELWAMMLDVTRTFDELVALLAPSAAVRDQILANQIYRNISSAVAGSQEYSAIAKLFELAQGGGYDTIVLDTPPSRNALDFLEAPRRLTAFLQGRAFALLALPGRRAARTAGVLLAALARAVGTAMLGDVADFLRLISELAPGLRDRAAGVSALLQDDSCAFVIVSSPERAPVAEAIFLAGQLAAARMHTRALVLNRTHPRAGADRDPQATSDRLAGVLGAQLAAKVARTHAEVQRAARRDAQALADLRRAMPGVQCACLLERESDVCDVETLHALADELFADAASPGGA
jgi:anion-transporting  ArsA/GET3 family ATPase